MAIQDKTTLQAYIDANLNTNGVNGVRGVHINTVLENIVDSVHGVYGALYVANASTAQSLNTTSAKLTGFTTDGLNAGTTPAHGTDVITVGTTGIYMVFAVLQGSGEASTTYTFNIAKNTTVDSNIQVRHITNGTNDFTVMLVGLVSCNASDTLSVYGKSSVGGGANFTLANGQVVVHRIA